MACLILTRNLWAICDYQWERDEEKGAKRGEITCPWSELGKDEAGLQVWCLASLRPIFYAKIKWIKYWNH